MRIDLWDMRYYINNCVIIVVIVFNTINNVTNLGYYHRYNDRLDKCIAHELFDLPISGTCELIYSVIYTVEDTIICTVS